MSYDRHGNFTRLHNWEQDRKDDIGIMSDRHDEEDDNFAEALNECLLRDGRVPLGGNLNAGNYQIKNVARATSDGDAVNFKQVMEVKDKAVSEYSDKMHSLCFIGDIKPSLQKSNHGAWLLCNGQAVSREKYKELFNLIGTSFGGGDGIKTFNVPDYRGKFLRGLGGDSAGKMNITQAEGLPNITGTTHAQDGYLRDPQNSGAFSSWVQVGGDTRSGDGGASASYGKFDASASNPIYGASNHVTPVNQAVNWFIRAMEE